MKKEVITGLIIGISIPVIVFIAFALYRKSLEKKVSVKYNTDIDTLDQYSVKRLREVLAEKKD